MLFCQAFDSLHAQFTSEQIDSIWRELPKTEEERIFYHWTKPDVGERWIQQGGLDQGEMDFYNQPTGDRQVYGAGIYFSEDPQSSRTFGSFLTIWKVRKGQPIYDNKIVERIMGRSLTNDEITELGKRIPFLRKVTSQWWLTHHAENLSHPVNPVLVEFLKEEPRFDRIQKVLEHIRKLNPQAADYLDSFFHLASYSDGLSLYRATTVNPTNPWHEFEPENFERYKAMRAKYLNEAHALQTSGGRLSSKDGITDGYANFGKPSGLFFGQSRDTWVKDQIDLLTRINSDVRGIASSFRTESVRAGGPEAGNRFLATHSQAAALAQNPYLELNVVPDPQQRGLLVEYHYPDVYHFKKLKGRLSDTLYHLLETTDPEKFKTDDKLRNETNQKIVSELLRGYIKSIHNTPINYAHFMATLISIHPYSDFNGRTVRIFSELAGVETSKILPHLFESDLDILTTQAGLKHNLAGATHAYTHFVRAVVEETFDAVQRKRMPIYFQHAIMNPILQAFHLGETDQQLTLADDDLERIRNRNMTDLYNRHLGFGWDVTAETLDEAYRYAVETKTEKIFFTALEASLSRRTVTNDDNLLLWTKVMANENYSKVLISEGVQNSQARMTRAVLTDMAKSLSDLEKIANAPNPNRYDYQWSNSEIYEVLRRWSILLQFSNAHPTPEGSKIVNSFETLLREHAKNFSKKYSGEYHNGVDWGVTKRLAMIARYFKDREHRDTILEWIANGLVIKGYPIPQSMEQAAYVLENVFGPEEIHSNKEWRLADNKKIEVWERVLDNFSDKSDIAVPMLEAIFHTNSERSWKLGKPEDEEAILKRTDGVVMKLLKTSNSHAHGLVDYGIRRKFSEEVWTDIYDANQLSGDKLRLETNRYITLTLGPNSFAIAQRSLRHGEDSEEHPWSIRLREKEMKNQKPLLNALRNFALDPTTIRPEGLSRNAQLHLLSSLISENLAVKAQIKKAREMLLASKRTSHYVSELAEALVKKGEVTDEIRDHFVPIIKAEIVETDLATANRAAGLALTLQVTDRISDKEISQNRDRIANAGRDYGVRQLGWVFAAKFPTDSLTAEIVRRAEDFDNESVCEWFDRQNHVSEELFKHLLSRSARPSMFGMYVDPKIVASIIVMLNKHPNDVAMWTAAFDRVFSSKAIFEKDLPGMMAKLVSPSAEVRAALPEELRKYFPSTVSSLGGDSAPALSDVRSCTTQVGQLVGAP